MIKKLKRKIVTYITLAIGLASILFAAGVSAYNIRRTDNELYNSLQNAAVQASHPSDEIGKPEIGKDKPDRLAPTNICVVRYSVDRATGSTSVSIVSGDAYISESVVSSAAKQAAENSGYDSPSRDKKHEGRLKEFDLAYYADVSPDGAYIAFADYEYLRSAHTKTIATAVCVAAAFTAIAFLLAVFLARMAVEPVENSIEEQKRFIADASHELKTPLAVISANNEILLAKADRDNRGWLNSSQEEIRNMKSVIDDMLTLAAGEAVGRLEKSPVDLTKLVERCALQFDAVAYEKSIKITTDIADGVIVKCDEKSVKRLIATLIDNAIKYEPSGGEVLITLAQSGLKAEFAVKNYGSVIAEEDIPHLFDRFYRADKSRSTDGVGLGLAIAKNIADNHGGTLKVTSGAGIGTTFKAEF